MASINKNTQGTAEKKYTFEGGVASNHLKPIEELRRSTMSALLWEDGFYQDGVAIANCIADLVSKVSKEEALDVLYKCKFASKLRHMPLYLLTLLAQQKWLRKEDVSNIITRADDMTELLSLYWKGGKKPLPKQMVKGIQIAFGKFDEYQLAKYNRAKEVKLRDVLRITRPYPASQEQSDLWKRLLADELKTPDTWEVLISACGKDSEKKKEVFTRLITENKLGDLAFIRNLRKMHEVVVDNRVIKESFKNRKWKQMLPFQFITAARYNPQYEPELEEAMMKCLKEQQPINKSVKLLVDVSGSMDVPLSARSETLRNDVASGLAVLLREVCSDIEIHTFSNNSVLIPSRHGFALRDAIKSSQPHSSTYLWKAVQTVGKGARSDLMIIITDEQSHDSGDIQQANTDLLVIINIAQSVNGVGYGKGSIHISGWSENVVTFLREYISGSYLEQSAKTESVA
jgi:hypothetical protein